MYEPAGGNLHLRLEHDIPAFEAALLFFALPKLLYGKVQFPFLTCQDYEYT